MPKYSLCGSDLKSALSENVRGISGNAWDESWANGALSRGIQVSGNRVLSGYIPVISGVTMEVNTIVTAAFYNANKGFISDTQKGIGIGEFVVPDNACFMRFYTEYSYDTTNDPQKYDPNNKPIVISLKTPDHYPENLEITFKGIAGNIWDESYTNGALNNGIATSGVRILSSFISVIPGLNMEINRDVIAAFYSSDKTYISKSQRDLFKGLFTIPAEARYMRFYTTADYDSESTPQKYDPVNKPIVISLHVPYHETESADGLLDQSRFQNGVIDNYGRVLPGSRIVYPDLVPLTPGKKMLITCQVAMRYYDSSRAYLSEVSKDQGIGYFEVPENAYYCRFYTLWTYDVTNDPQIYANDIFLYEVDASEVTKATPYHRIKVMSWNVHKFCYGTPNPGGCEQDKVSERLPLWKQRFIDEISPDILIIIEWWDTFDHDGTIDTYEEIFKQFYPYKAAVSNYVCLLSKIPMTFRQITNGTNMILGTSTEYDLQVVTWVQGNTASVSYRESRYTQLLDNFVSPFSTVIVAGDFNNDAGPEELHVFTDAGYILGNNGYWGQINTCTSTTSEVGFAAIDNIVVGKGIINKFKKIDDMITSDHNAVVADISY